VAVVGYFIPNLLERTPLKDWIPFIHHYAWVLVAGLAAWGLMKANYERYHTLELTLGGHERTNIALAARIASLEERRLRIIFDERSRTEWQDTHIVDYRVGVQNCSESATIDEVRLMTDRVDDLGTTGPKRELRGEAIVFDEWRARSNFKYIARKGTEVEDPRRGQFTLYSRQVEELLVAERMKGVKSFSLPFGGNSSWVVPQGHYRMTLVARGRDCIESRENFLVGIDEHGEFYMKRGD